MSPTVVLSVSESDVLAALRAFLLPLVPSTWEVIRGLQNRVAPPAGSYVLMTPIGRERLSTNRRLSAPFSVQILQATRMTVQVDVRGESADDVAYAIATLFRDTYGVAALKASGLPIAPLYTTSPKQIPLVTAEKQYQDRWSLDVDVQVNAILTVTQQTAETVLVGIHEIDETFPPKGAP